jgi:hypothetical protein
MASINWPAFKQASTRGAFYPHRITLVKYYHGILPTGKIAHRNDPTHPVGCPSCTCPLEHEDHVILCPSSDCRQWRSNFILGLQNFLASPAIDSQPHMSDILQHGTLLWFRNEYYDPNTVLPRFRTLVEEQKAIGWHNLFCGQLSREWQRHQDIYLKSQQHPDPKRVAYSGRGPSPPIFYNAGCNCGS